MRLARNSYLLNFINFVLLASAFACGKAEEEEEIKSSSTIEDEKQYQPETSNTYYSGCVTPHPDAPYQGELRQISFSDKGTYSAKITGYETTDCSDDNYVAAVIETEGNYQVKENYEEGDSTGAMIQFTRTSLTVTVADEYQLDHWNGTLTAKPICDDYKSKMGNNIETIEMNCLDADGTYTLAPQTPWTELVLAGDDTISLSRLAFGDFPTMRVWLKEPDLGEPLLVKQAGKFAEGEKRSPMMYSFSGIVNDYFFLSSKLNGTSWQACYQGDRITFSFTSSTYTQTAEVDVGDDCSASAAYTVRYSGQYTIAGGLDYVVGGFKINYTNTDTRYTVHAATALGDLFNGTTAGTTAFCSGFTFTLDTETSINGKDCKPRPEMEGAYATVGSSALYDIIMFRDDELIDSRYTEEGQGSSDSARPYYFNGDLRYKKQ